MDSESLVAETAFRIAVSDAFYRGLRESGIVLLEPIMNLEISTPDEYVGNIVSDLQQRNGLVTQFYKKACVRGWDAFLFSRYTANGMKADFAFLANFAVKKEVNRSVITRCSILAFVIHITPALVHRHRRRTCTSSTH